MTDELLFADRTGEENDGETTKEKTLFEKIKDKLKENLDEDTTDNSETSNNKLGSGILNNDEEEYEETWIDKIDRLTVVLVLGEAFLLIYFILAMLNILPLF